MSRKFLALAVAVLALPLVGFGAPESVKEIMVKGHKGAGSLLTKIGAEAKAKKWDDAAKNAATLKEFGDALPGLKPKKGDEESWKKLSEAYKDQTAAVAAAVEKKDADETAKALKAISGSCGGCHGKHK